MVLRPAPNTKSPRWNARSWMRSLSSRRAVFGVLIVHQLEANHQAQPPDVADILETLGPIAHPAQDVTAELGRVRDQLAFQ